MIYLNMKVNSLGRYLSTFKPSAYQDNRDSYSTSLNTGDPQTLKLYETAKKKPITTSPEEALRLLI